MFISVVKLDDLRIEVYGVRLVLGASGFELKFWHFGWLPSLAQEVAVRAVLQIL